MTDAENTRLKWIIHGAATAAAGIGAGLAGIPYADTIALVHLQTTMVAAIGRLHGADPSYNEAMQLVLGVGGSAAGRLAAKGLGRWAPRRIPLVNAVTAAVITEAIGWAAHRAFANRASGVTPAADPWQGVWS